MIRLTIQRKVFLATFALASTMALLLTLTIRWNLGQGFERYTSAAEFARLDWMVARFEAEYAAHGNWDFLLADPDRTWHRLIRPPERQGGWPPPGPAGWQGGWPPPPPAPDPNQEPPAAPGAEPNPVPNAAPGAGRQPEPAADALRVGPRLTLLDAGGRRLAGNANGAGVRAERPIVHQGQVVGRLALQAAPTSAQQLDAAFLSSQTQQMLLAGVAALLFSMLAAWLLARHFLAPIRQLAGGARKIADGALDTRILIPASDEFGELGATFNEMAERLFRQEESRRAWISETSHELRTPLAVLQAEIEALQDGVRTPDAPTLDRLHKQVRQLSKLVDDLRQTLDGGSEQSGLDMESVAPVAILEECVTSFRHRYEAAGIAIDTSWLTDSGYRVRGDAARLTQVFGNLLENTLRYTHSGGRLVISSLADKGWLQLRFDDTAPAPPASALPRLFERFFRVEPSRSRALGGSGLGLAICKNIVEAHGGRISASLSKLGGLQVAIELPLHRP